MAADSKITVNMTKSDFAHAYVTYLGHIVGQGQVRPRYAKVKCILEYPVPTTRKELMRFLGMTGYYRKFFKNFADIVSHLTNLLSKQAKFVWSEHCQKAFFDQVKAVLTHTPVLMAPDFDKPFTLVIDASDVAVGSVLVQDDKEGTDHPLSFYSKKLNIHQKWYSTVEKEMLTLILALQHFEVYVASGQFLVEVFTDHNPLTFLSKMKDKNQRLTRWSLFLQE